MIVGAERLQVSPPRIMKLKIGTPATGDNFFLRNRLRDRILRALQRDHLAFLGPRRTGKTSILREIESHPPEGIAAVYLDLQGLRSVPAWLNLMLNAARQLIQEPPDRLKWFKWTGQKLKNGLERIEEISILGNEIKLTSGQPAVESWEPLAEKFLALLQEEQLPIYFMLDEFPWFLGHVSHHHTPAEVDATLNWFRRVRLALGDMPSRFLITGSIGLTGLLRRLNLSPAANDFDTIGIEPLQPSESLEFLEKLAEGEGLTIPPPLREQILQRLGVGWPLLLSTFVSEIQDRESQQPLTAADIDDIYHRRMVRGSRNKYCEEMYARLPKPELFSPSERRLAQEILRALSPSDASVGTDDLQAIHARIVPDEALRITLATELDVVIDTLLHDGYVHRRDDGRIEFASNILRDFWRHRTA